MDTAGSRGKKEEGGFEPHWSDLLRDAVVALRSGLTRGLGGGQRRRGRGEATVLYIAVKMKKEHVYRGEGSRVGGGRDEMQGEGERCYGRGSPLMNYFDRSSRGCGDVIGYAVPLLLERRAVATHAVCGLTLGSTVGVQAKWRSVGGFVWFGH